MTVNPGRAPPGAVIDAQRGHPSSAAPAAPPESGTLPRSHTLLFPMTDSIPASATPRLRRMAGRDPHEHGRTGTALELLFDLVFVIAVGQAASQLAHLLAEGHDAAGIGGFAFAMFATLWAWVNFAWFASAFDTDDWVYRLCTMVQMVGVTVLALGLAPMFHSLDASGAVDNRLMVAGYVVMRVAMLCQWLRAARQAPAHRAACMAYVYAITVAQVGWIAQACFDLPLLPTALLTLALILVEMGGPYLAETRHGGTPWHAHHIAERYAGLAIMALGEGIVGTVASLSAVVQEQGWSLDAVLVVVAGMGLTFGMWWCYFAQSPGQILHARRERSFLWGYGSLPVFAAIAATGAGLDVAAMFIEHKAHITPAAAVAALAVPVLLYLAGIYALYGVLYRHDDALHRWLMAVTVVVLAAAPILAALGTPMAVCLLVVMAAPALWVVGYETLGHRHMAQALARVVGP